MFKYQIYFIVSLIVYGMNCHAQKPNLTDTSYRSWTTVGSAAISNDGRFAWYIVNNDHRRTTVLVIKSTDLKWEMNSNTYTNPVFSDDSKYLFAMSGDTLIQLKLKTTEIKKIPNCQNFQLFTNKKEEYLIFLASDTSNIMTVKNLNTGKTSICKNIDQYTLNIKGDAIIATKKLKGKALEVIQWFDYKKNSAKKIYQGPPVNNLIVGHDGSSFAFTTKVDGRTFINYYHITSPFCQIIASDASVGIKDGHHIETNDIWKFSIDDKSLFFTQQKSQDEQDTGINVWNYKDAILRSEFEKRYRHQTKNLYSSAVGLNLTILDIGTRKVTKLLNGLQKLTQSYEHDADDVLLAESTFAEASESPWNQHAFTSYYLCFTKTANVVAINPNNEKFSALELSPNNKFLVYYDHQINSYKSYNLETKIKRIIAKQVGEKFFQYSGYKRGLDTTTVNYVAGWVPSENKVILQGSYNLWLVDLENKSLPINLTIDGRKSNNIIYSLGNISSDHQIRDGEEIVIGGFNIKTKQYGIYKNSLLQTKVKRLAVGNNWGYPYNRINDGAFIQAKRSNSFLFKMESASQSANYYFTKDFKQIIPISNNYPEKNYNWITSELIKYADSNGNDYEGIMYMPENFQPSKKYPVIFNYYLEESIKVNNYVSPVPSGSGPSIPFLVSNGYVVFIPAIYKSNGNSLGESALMSINGAIDYSTLTNLINREKMGIIGHSMAGFETNYIIAHSNIFKAAVSLAGISNVIENYNDLWAKGNPKQNYIKSFMDDQGMEENPRKYVDNSPILMASKIKTPVLLMHNDKDPQVPVNQSIQFFVQLRKLQKPVWMLQYENEGHTVRNTSFRLDLQNKIKDFFDYYLMGKPIPKWMDSPIRPD